MIANLSDAKRALFYHGERREGKIETLLTQAEYFLSIRPSNLNFFATLLSFWGFSGSAGCCIAGSLGSQAEFAEVLLGE